MKKPGLLCVLAVTCATYVAAAEIPQVRAEREGLSTERLVRITDLSQRYVDEGKLAGVLTMVARDGKIVHYEAVGHRGVNDPRPLTKDALFRIYSMTKPIAAVAAMILYEEGAFELHDPVSKYLPELKDLMVWRDGAAVPATNTMTMQHLLTHTAGFSYGFDPNDPVDKLYRNEAIFESADLDEFVTRVAKLPLKFEPGSQWHYSVAVDLTGLVVQRISGQRFDEFLAQRLFKPLGMNDTFFSVPDDKLDRFLPNHSWDDKANKLVDFDGARFGGNYRGTTLYSGGGGLVSTAMDYMRFAEMLRAGGSLDGVRILSPKTVQFMTMDHLPASVGAAGTGERPTVNVSTFRGGFGFGLGFGIVTDVAALGVMGSVGEYSWGGAAGTIFWVDPVEDIVAIGMIQLMGSPWPLRSELKVLTNQAITRLKN